MLAGDLPFDEIAHEQRPSHAVARSPQHAHSLLDESAPMGEEASNEAPGSPADLAAPNRRDPRNANSKAAWNRELRPPKNFREVFLAV